MVLQLASAGVFVLCQPELSYFEAFYHCMITATTVGYGDFYPATTAGRAFTTIYSIIGITVVLAKLNDLMGALRGDWREKIAELLRTVRIEPTAVPALGRAGEDGHPLVTLDEGENPL